MLLLQRPRVTMHPKPASRSRTVMMASAHTQTLSLPSKNAESSQYDEKGQKIRRSVNSWILYRQDMLAQYRRFRPNGITPQKHLSKWFAKLWQQESEEVREYYGRKSRAAAAEHALRYPTYRYKPERRECRSHRTTHQAVTQSTDRGSNDTAVLSRVSAKRNESPQPDALDALFLNCPPLLVPADQASNDQLSELSVSGSADVSDGPQVMVPTIQDIHANRDPPTDTLSPQLLTTEVAAPLVFNQSQFSNPAGSFLNRRRRTVTDVA